MRLQILSDLHIECGDFNFRRAQGVDRVCLLGDIFMGLGSFDWACDNVRDNFIYILGNHEFYGNAWTMPDALMCSRYGGILENRAIDLDEFKITIIGTTLWTDFNLHGDAPIAQFSCTREINDFKVVYGMAAQGISERHAESVLFLKKAVHYAKYPCVVLSHFAPSGLSVPLRYTHDECSPYFASRLENFILDSGGKIRLWAHGHTHDSFDYTLGDTRIVCNPRGYVGKEMNNQFDPMFVVEV